MSILLNNPIGQALIAAALTAIFALGARLLLAASAHFQAQAADTKATTAQRIRDSILAHAFKLAQVVTSDLEATVRPTLPSVLASGKLSPTDAATLKLNALTRLKQYLTPDGEREIEDALGIVQGSPLDQLLGSLIEKAHAETK